MLVPIVLLAACGESRSDQHEIRANFRPIARDTFAMTFDREASRSAVETAVRRQCAGKSWCKVIGWSDADAAATAMPMTDREVAAVRFNYTLNRESGMDEAAWTN